MTPPSPRLEGAVLIRDVIARINTLAPPGLAYSWDRVGLQIGDGGAPVCTVLVALTITPEAVARARAIQARLIIAHHPLIWAPFDRLLLDDPHTRLCLSLAHDNIAVFAAHTNLDLAEGGVNDLLARRLGLTRIQSLIPAPHARRVKLITFAPPDHTAGILDALHEAGAGRIGAYTRCSFTTRGTGAFLPAEEAHPHTGDSGSFTMADEHRMEVVVEHHLLPRVLTALRAAHPYEEPAYDIIPLEGGDPACGLGRRGMLPNPLPLDVFAGEVRTLLGAPHVRVIGKPDRMIASVGVIGGSGGGEIAKLPSGLDALLTGDVKYHDALEAQTRGIAVVDAGHGPTEMAAVGYLAARIAASFPCLRVVEHREDDPFRVIL